MSAIIVDSLSILGILAWFRYRVQSSEQLTGILRE